MGPESGILAYTVYTIYKREAHVTNPTAGPQQGPIGQTLLHQSLEYSQHNLTWSWHSPQKIRGHNIDTQIVAPVTRTPKRRTLNLQEHPGSSCAGPAEGPPQRLTRTPVWGSKGGYQRVTERHLGEPRGALRWGT